MKAERFLGTPNFDYRSLETRPQFSTKREKPRAASGTTDTETVSSGKKFDVRILFSSPFSAAGYKRVRYLRTRFRLNFVRRPRVAISDHRGGRGGNTSAARNANSS